MYINNPYAQAGWHNPKNPHSINDRPWHPNTGHAPTFGALPVPENSPSSVLTFEFRFSAAIPHSLNCIVIGPKQLEFFAIQTIPSSGTTIISKSGQNFAVIQWNQPPINPTVEARGILAYQYAGEFLRLSSEQSSRTMLVSGKSYTWVPRKSGIYLFSSGPNPPQEYARTSISQDMTKILLQITSEGFQAEIFEPSIIATTLMFSGRRFD